MVGKKRPHLEVTTAPAPAQAGSAMNEYINMQLTPAGYAHPAHAMAPPESGASASSRRRLGTSPDSPAPPTGRGLNQLSVDQLNYIAQFLPVDDMARLARTSSQTGRIPIERVAQAVSPIRGISLGLRECFARVQPEEFVRRDKSWIETEEQSLKALTMQEGGARHFFRANDMLQYLLSNWTDHHENEVVIVIPYLRQRISNENGPWRLALERAGYPVSGTPAVVQTVTGNENYKTLANLWEYRVGHYESDQVISIPAENFVSNIAVQEGTLKQGGKGCFECGLRFDGLHVPIRIWFDQWDFFSVKYQKNVLDILDYQDILKKFRRPG